MVGYVIMKKKCMPCDCTPIQIARTNICLLLLCYASISLRNPAVKVLFQQKALANLNPTPALSFYRGVLLPYKT